MEAKQLVHWGKWLKSRSRVVGFMTDAALAKSIGCTRERISTWSHMEFPPTGMRKSLDSNLAAALKTTRETLFNGYRTISPQAAPFIDSSAVQAGSEIMRRRVLAMVELMPNDGLKELARVGEQILHKGMLQVA